MSRLLPILCLLPSLALAYPVTITTSGYVLDGADQPLEAASTSVAFSIWNDASDTAPTARIWPASGASTCTTAVRGGYYTVLLDGNQTTGCGALLDSTHLPASAPRWLEITIGGITLSPRSRFGMSPTSADTQALIATLAAGGTSVNGTGSIVDWKALKGVPLTLADNVDNDTTYTAGAGLALSSGAFSLELGGANQLLGMNAGGTAPAYKTLTGTANQIAIAHSAGAITLSTPQRIDTGATPAFAGATLSGTLTAGQVGIGTTVADERLSVGDGTGAANVHFKTNGAGTSLHFHDAVNDSHQYIGHLTTTSMLQFRASASGPPHVVLDSAGNLGIGSVSPGYKLDVAGDVRASGVFRGDGSGLTNLPGASSSTGPSDARNCGFTASVASNALTISLVAADGTALSTSNACVLRFRPASLTSGTSVARTVSSALSLTVPSGTNLGLLASDASPIHLYAVDNAGTVGLGVSLTAGISRYNLTSTSAISGGAGSTTLYTSAALTNVPTLYLGYVVAAQSTAGTWASAPTEVTFTGPRSGRMGQPEARAVNTTFLAATDGFIWVGAVAAYYTVQVGPTAGTVTGLVGYSEANTGAANGTQHTAPVHKGQYYRVQQNGGNTPSAYWVATAD